jgi:hypothetical protein
MSLGSYDVYVRDCPFWTPTTKKARNARYAQLTTTAQTRV